MHGCTHTLNGSWGLACAGLCLLFCVGAPLGRAGGVAEAYDFDARVGEGVAEPALGAGANPAPDAAELVDAPYLRRDRYTFVRGAARPDQRQPLAATMRIAFGDDIRTIGQAVVELLERSGYQLAHSDQANCLLVRELLFRQPLPASLRDLGPVPLLSGLDALIGTAWGVRVNELGRTLQLRINPEYRDEQWLRRFMEERHSTAAMRSQTWFAPFALAEFRTLGDAAHRAIRQAADAARAQDWRLALRGHSHSHARWATAEQARRRAQTVAAALERLGVQRRQLTVETRVSNHREPTEALRHGVEIELRDPQVAARVSACGKLPPAARGAADTAARHGHFTVRRGSLKANVKRLLGRFSLRVGQWSLSDGDYEYDWDIPYEYQVPAPDAEQALSALLESYDIQPTLNLRDRTVDFAPRYAPRRTGLPE